MDFTKDDIKEKFKLFNKLYFNGELRMPSKFTIQKMNLAAGRIEVNAKAKKPYVTIIISNCFDYNENTLDEVIIHEMLHYYLFVKGSKNAFKHKKEFVEQCDRLLRDFGLHIHTNAKHIKIYDVYKPKRTKIEKFISLFVKPFMKIFS